MKLLIKEMFLDESVEVFTLIGNSYDPEKHLHYVRINKGSIGLTDTFKGQKGDWHQILRVVELEIRDDAPPFICTNLNRILSKYDIEFEKIK